MNAFRVTRMGETLKVEGELRIGGIVQALELLRRELAHGPAAMLDLAGVTACDSSAVALMLEMRRQGVSRIRHVPADMEAIVRACQLETLLATDPSPSSVAGRLNHNEHS
ncbi:MAG: STAS domain-containing protein [Halothiobacillaceae bacterium]